MNWWRLAKIDSYEDRNHVNERIVKLQALCDILRYAAKLVNQTQRGARRMVEQIRNNKSLASYESIIDVLSQADKCAMDSPQKFSLFVNHAAKVIEEKIAELEEERIKFTEETLPHRLKGLRDE